MSLEFDLPHVQPLDKRKKNVIEPILTCREILSHNLMASAKLIASNSRVAEKKNYRQKKNYVTERSNAICKTKASQKVMKLRIQNRQSQALADESCVSPCFCSEDEQLMPYDPEEENHPTDLYEKFAASLHFQEHGGAPP